jgi:dUTP pyrophosphatase
VRKTEYVYLACPIDFARRETEPGRIERISAPMQEEDLAAYVPGYAFKHPTGALSSPVVGRVNRAALTECAALVAFLPPPGTTSFGVPMEIEQARSEGKPVYIIGQREQAERSFTLPLGEQWVRFSEEFGYPEARQLRAMINSQINHRTKPRVSRSMYVRLDIGGSLPTRAYEGDAGFDLYVNMTTNIPAGGFVDVPMGCSVQLPDGVWAMITGRSSTVRNLDLLVTTGIIDSGYRGPLFAGVRSLRTDDYTVKRGERIAQLIPFPNVAAELHATPVDVLSPSDRGEAGFGSSGV